MKKIATSDTYDLMLPEITRIEFCQQSWDEDNKRFIAKYGGAFTMRTSRFSDNWIVYRIPPHPNTDDIVIVKHPIYGYHMSKNAAIELAREIEMKHNYFLQG